MLLSSLLESKEPPGEGQQANSLRVSPFRCKSEGGWEEEEDNSSGGSNKGFMSVGSSSSSRGVISSIEKSLPKSIRDRRLEDVTVEEGGGLFTTVKGFSFRCLIVNVVIVLVVMGTLLSALVEVVRAFKEEEEDADADEELELCRC